MRPAIKRFLEKTARRENGCLEWTGTISPNGYGKFWIDNKTIGAHRAAWKLYKGREPIPGKFIYHHCDNKKCVEETHLFEDYPRGNSLDAALKGILGNKPKLTWHEQNLVRLSIQDNRLTYVDIGTVFNVSVSTVDRIKKGGYYRADQ